MLTIHSLYLCDKRRNHWHDSSCNGNFINPGRDRVRSRTLRQPRLARFSLLPKHVVIGKKTQGLSSQAIRFLHLILCPYSLGASGMYNTFSISIRRRKKNYAVVLHPFWFTQVEVLAWCYYAWVLLIYNTFSISIRSRKKKLGCRSISFLVHPGRSPGIILLCLSASRIYTTFRISQKKN